MPRVAILVAASPTRAFFSQLAVLSLAMRKLSWSQWQPSLRVYLGGHHDPDALAQWLPHLADIDVSWVSDARFAREGDWAQSDDVFRCAPRDADVLVTMDADTMPVADLEDVLDRTLHTDSVAGVIAHYPFPRPDHMSSAAAWLHIAEGLIEAPLAFDYSHTLLAGDAPAEHRLTPFYVNFGFVLFPRSAFDRVVSPYLHFRHKLMDRMVRPPFAGQAALALAIASGGVTALALPMRYNFPNDSLAETMYPDELSHVTVFHYLRTDKYDRHRIFASARAYAAFLSLPLTGVDLSFQNAVRRVVGSDYPFV
jgi:hypothetical protein